LDPAILAVMARFDPGNANTVPCLHGVNGFAHNVDMIKARMPNPPVDSLDMVFIPETISKFADCGVSFMDNAEDVLQLALIYLHLNPNTQKPEDFKAAEALLLAVRPYVRTFDSEGLMNALPNKDLCIAMSWSGDFETAEARAKAAGVNIDLAFSVPKEGANIWYDAWLIPNRAPHEEAASGGARSVRSATPTTNRLTIIADGGSSDGLRVRLWKRELQELANELGIDINVHHLLPGTGTWN